MAMNQGNVLGNNIQLGPAFFQLTDFQYQFVITGQKVYYCHVLSLFFAVFLLQNHLFLVFS